MSTKSLACSLALSVNILASSLLLLEPPAAVIVPSKNAFGFELPPSNLKAYSSLPLVDFT